jgi:hypothetical protein
MASGKADTALRLVGALWWSWLLHDRRIEAHDLLETAPWRCLAQRATPWPEPEHCMAHG